MQGPGVGCGSPRRFWAFYRRAAVSSDQPPADCVVIISMTGWVHDSVKPCGGGVVGNEDETPAAAANVRYKRSFVLHAAS